MAGCTSTSTSTSTSIPSPTPPFTPETPSPFTPSPFIVFPFPSPSSPSILSPTSLPFTTALNTPCTYQPQIFASVMENLLSNPNITSSHLFRADIFWDSLSDVGFDAATYFEKGGRDEAGIEVFIGAFVRWMREEVRPRVLRVGRGQWKSDEGKEEDSGGWEMKRCLVRKLVPRNTKLDGEMVQTCQFWGQKRVVRRCEIEGSEDASEKIGGSGARTSEGTKREEDRGGEHEQGDYDEERNLIIYIPHIDDPEQMPWYHPKVKALAFLHTWRTPIFTFSTILTNGQPPPPRGDISLHILPYPSTSANLSRPPSAFQLPTATTTEPSTRLLRTLHSLLSTIHKHGNGHLRGYTSRRVAHDTIIPQADLQDTYTRLKNTYAKKLLREYWSEQTDATKGVFEDLGIAAFLVELWRRMYRGIEKGRPYNGDTARVGDGGEGRAVGKIMEEKAQFPGFVDVACGNGVLVYILLSEGYPGWGFDARRRKTWGAFPEEVRMHLFEMVLVPALFQGPSQVSQAQNDGATKPSSASLETQSRTGMMTNLPTHNGIFTNGTFVISNHADELTAWTPLLAYLSHSPFVCIPCCSHDLSGAKFRAPVSAVDGVFELRSAVCEIEDDEYESVKLDGNGTRDKAKYNVGTQEKAEKKGTRATSAYATLCNYVARLARDVGFEPEKEILRIPSTRNVAVVGRSVMRKSSDELGGKGSRDQENVQRRAKVAGIVERELGRRVDDVGREWRESARRLVEKKGRNH